MYSYTSSGKPVCLLGWSDVQCRSRRPRVRSLSVSSWVTSVTAVWTRSCSTTVSMAPAKRVEATVDLGSGHKPEAYKSKAMPSLGRSWSVHSLIHLLPLYHQKLKSRKPITRWSEVWSREATETLGGFHCTVQDILLTGASVNEWVEVTTV